jgi:hypothetical protein
VRVKKPDYKVAYVQLVSEGSTAQTNLGLCSLSQLCPWGCLCSRGAQGPRPWEAGVGVELRVLVHLCKVSQHLEGTF